MIPVEKNNLKTLTNQKCNEESIDWEFFFLVGGCGDAHPLIFPYLIPLRHGKRRRCEFIIWAPLIGNSEF